MTRPLLLDTYCGAGGAAMGYHLAGWEVIGVDIEPQPRYPFEFVQADALAFMDLRSVYDFDAIHASPPCQDHSVTKSIWPDGRHGTEWLLRETIWRLREIGLPYVVENVGGARHEMGGAWFQLCGSSFGLGVIRHRLFASSQLMLAPPCQHETVRAPLSVFGHSEDTRTCNRYEAAYGMRPGQAERGVAMGIDWMNRDELAQAIPPAFTEWIGSQLLAALPSEGERDEVP